MNITVKGYTSQHFHMPLRFHYTEVERSLRTYQTLVSSTASTCYTVLHNSPLVGFLLKSSITLELGNETIAAVFSEDAEIEDLRAYCNPKFVYSVINVNKLAICTRFMTFGVFLVSTVHIVYNYDMPRIQELKIS